MPDRMPGSYTEGNDSDWVPASGSEMSIDDSDDVGESIEAAEEANTPRRPTGRTTELRLGIDPNTQTLYLIDGNNQTRITSALLNRMPDLRALLASRLGETWLPSNNDDDDDEEEDDSWDNVFFGRSSNQRTTPAPVIFPVKTEPDDQGMRLEQCGEFGMTSRSYTQSKRELRAYSNNVSDRLRSREMSWRKPLRTDLAETCIPNSVGTEVCRYQANIYCGQYSDDGSFYYTCGQDFKIRIYDTSEPPSSAILSNPKSTRDSEPEKPEETTPSPRAHRWGRSYVQQEDETVLKVIKTVQGHDAYSRWTITDANLSPANDALIYSSIGPVVNLVRTEQGQSVDSLSTNASDHVQLNFAGNGRDDFGIWSVRFSGDAREIVAGARGGSIFVYNIEAGRSVLRIAAHDNDVNAVCFADSASSNVLVSGSDDYLLKVWDRRSMRGQTPSGVLIGHTEGITFVSPKGDGRYVVSNGKDQTAKLWDLRKMYSATDADDIVNQINPHVRGWDYRKGLYRKPKYAKHPKDASVMTYTGHSVLTTLIRCHFSPAHSTGQRYIYSGSADGRIHIWNLDGRINTILDRTDVKPLYRNPYDAPTSQRQALPTPSPEGGIRCTVRDVSWHPIRPEMLSVSWEGRMGSSGSVALHRWSGSA